MSDTTTRCTFTRDSLTIDGITRPAEYSVTPAGTVFVFVAVDVDGQERKVRIKIPADDPRCPGATAGAGAARPGAARRRGAGAGPGGAARPRSEAGPRPRAGQGFYRP